MKKDKLKYFIMLFILVLVYLYFNISKYNGIINTLTVIVIILLCLYILIDILINNSKNLKPKNKLFNSIMEISDTVYILIDLSNPNYTYISDNVKNILGLDTLKLSNNDIIDKILNIPIIKDEIKKWNKSSEYVSEMVKHYNPKYNYNMWIRVKIINYKDDYKEYQVIQVIDATKEYDRQHLLIKQASNIKARESQLNQITSSSYDFQININIESNSCDLKYFKMDKLYFGDEKRGNYTDLLSSFSNYINDSDKDLFNEKLSLNNLKEHFIKYELDSITFRYRVGNKIKNNEWLESTIFFISNKENNLVTVLTKNVTENAESIRSQNILLQNALNEAKLADKAKTDLISQISYNLRTPLSNIIGLSSSLMDKKLDTQILDDIKNINKSSLDALNIIDGLIDPNNILKATLTLNEKCYSIFKMFKILEDEAKDYIQNENVKFKVNLDNNLPLVLYGDYKKITEVFRKIINNSIKYTSEGEIVVNVKGEKKGKNYLLVVSINDTGCGIENKTLENIMSSNNYTGGIGTAKKLIELLDGKIEFESEVGKYTTVTVSILQKIVEDNRIRETIKDNKELTSIDLSNKKVLVVDDNILNLKVTRRILSDYKLDVTLVESGFECLEKIKAGNEFDLILMDQMMPALSGAETLEKLKEIKGFNIPVIVLTADAIIGQKEKYMEMGFDGYLSKPINKKELNKLFKLYLEKEK